MRAVSDTPAVPAPAAPAPDQRFGLRWLPVWLAATAALWFPLAIVLFGRGALAPSRQGFALRAGWIYVATLLWFAAGARRGRLPLPRLLGPAPRPGGLFEGVLAVGLHLSFSFAGALAAFAALARWAPALFARLESAGRQAFDFGATPAPARWLLIVLLAPLTEEVLFRGVLFHRCARRWGVRRGALATAALFGILHLNPVGIFAFGLLLQVLYLRTRSLWVTAFAHALNNGIPLAMNALAGGGGASSPGERAALAHSLGPTALLAAFFTLALLLYLVRAWPRADAPAPWAAPGAEDAAPAG